MLPDNYRALSLTKKMGFTIDYLEDGTVKASLNLKEEDIDVRCIKLQNQPTAVINLPEPPVSQLKSVPEMKSAGKKPEAASA